MAPRTRSHRIASLVLVLCLALIGSAGLIFAFKSMRQLALSSIPATTESLWLASGAACWMFLAWLGARKREPAAWMRAGRVCVPSFLVAVGTLRQELHVATAYTRAADNTAILDEVQRAQLVAQTSGDRIGTLLVFWVGAAAASAVCAFAGLLDRGQGASKTPQTKRSRALLDLLGYAFC